MFKEGQEILFRNDKEKDEERLMVVGHYHNRQGIDVVLLWHLNHTNRGFCLNGCTRAHQSPLFGVIDTSIVRLPDSAMLQWKSLKDLKEGEIKTVIKPLDFLINELQREIL